VVPTTLDPNLINFATHVVSTTLDPNLTSEKTIHALSWSNFPIRCMTRLSACRRQRDLGKQVRVEGKVGVGGVLGHTEDPSRNHVKFIHATTPRARTSIPSGLRSREQIGDNHRFCGRIVFCGGK
jgi:hypothetical protein